MSCRVRRGGSGRRAVLVLALGCAVVLGLVSCGGGGNQSQGKGPASVVPADAAAYVDVTVRPREKQLTPLRGALDRLFGTPDPGRSLNQLAGRALARAGWKADFRRDVEPWVGGQIAAFTTTLEPDAPLTLVFTLRDRAKALAAARAAGRPAGTFGIIGRFLVSSATPAGYRASLAVAKGRSLASTDAFDDALHTAPGGRVAIGYLDSRALYDKLAASHSLAGDSKEALRRRLGGLVSEPIMFALRPAEIPALQLDVSFEPIAPASALPSGSTPILGRAPATSAAALSVANIGDFIRHQIEQTDTAGRAAAELALRFRGGVDLDRDVLDWLDDGAAFVQGGEPGSLEGAATFDSSDRDASKAAAKRLAPLAPPDVFVRARGERVVVARGRDAFDWALDPPAGKGRLSQFSRFQKAKDNLGFAVSGFAGVRRSIALLASSSIAANPLYRAALPYLRRMTYVALGWGSSRGRDRIRLMAGLQRTEK